MLKRSAVTETIAHLECMRWEGKVLKLAQGANIVTQRIVTGLYMVAHIRRYAGKDMVA